jgi:hypothetical protein
MASCLKPDASAAFVLHLFSFDVSRLGGIGRSMFILSFLIDQTGRFNGQRLC